MPVPSGGSNSPLAQSSDRIPARRALAICGCTGGLTEEALANGVRSLRLSASLSVVEISSGAGSLDRTLDFYWASRRRVRLSSRLHFAVRQAAITTHQSNPTRIICTFGISSPPWTTIERASRVPSWHHYCPARRPVVKACRKCPSSTLVTRHTTVGSTPSFAVSDANKDRITERSSCRLTRQRCFRAPPRYVSGRIQHQAFVGGAQTGPKSLV